MSEINFSEGNYSSDTGKIIRKFDIYLCDLGEGEFISGGDIGKTRPCVIISSDNYNNPKSCRYVVAPIRTEHKEDITKNNVESFVKRKKETGTLYVPLEMAPDDLRFIDITEMKKVASSKLIRYLHSVINPSVKDRINKTIVEFLFSDEELSNLVPKREAAQPIQIATTNTTTSESKSSENEYYTNTEKLTNVLKMIDDGELSIDEAIVKTGMNENSIIFCIKQRRRKENINLVDTKMFLKLYQEWKDGDITAKDAAHELRIIYSSFYGYANKVKKNNLITK